MTAKKSTPIKAVSKKGKSAMTKIAETIGEVAGEISVRKDQLTGLASIALKAVKSKIHEATAPDIKSVNKAAIKVVKKAEPKKTIKAVNKKADKKVVQPASKKATAIKKAVGKTTIKATKKASPARQATVKAVKKVSVKK